MKDNRAVLTIENLARRMGEDLGNPMGKGEALDAIESARRELGNLLLHRDIGGIRAQVQEALRLLAKAEALVRMDTVSVGCRVAFSALSEFIRNS